MSSDPPRNLPQEYPENVPRNYDTRPHRSKSLVDFVIQRRSFYPGVCGRHAGVGVSVVVAVDPRSVCSQCHHECTVRYRHQRRSTGRSAVTVLIVIGITVGTIRSLCGSTPLGRACLYSVLHLIFCVMMTRCHHQYLLCC